MRNPRINRETTCCFSGYRPSKLPWKEDETDRRCIALKIKLYDVLEALYEAGIRHFICGMANGSDMYFCEEALKLRDDREGVTVEAAIPCEEQAARWDEKTRNRYFRLVAECDFESMISNHYTDDCMLKRNMYMVDNSSVLVAVFDGKLGGTMHTVNYAKKQGLEIIEIAP